LLAVIAAITAIAAIAAIAGFVIMKAYLLYNVLILKYLI
jgi:hypothetical protein